MFNREKPLFSDYPVRRIGENLLRGASRVLVISPAPRHPRASSPEEALGNAFASLRNAFEAIPTPIEQATTPTDIRQTDEGIKGE